MVRTGANGKKGSVSDLLETGRIIGNGPRHQ